MGFSRQEYWSRLPFPSPGDLPDLGIEPKSPALQADSLPSDLPMKPFLSLVELKSIQILGNTGHEASAFQAPEHNQLVFLSSQGGKGCYTNFTGENTEAHRLID